MTRFPRSRFELRHYVAMAAVVAMSVFGAHYVASNHLAGQDAHQEATSAQRTVIKERERLRAIQRRLDAMSPSTAPPATTVATAHASGQSRPSTTTTVTRRTLLAPSPHPSHTTTTTEHRTPPSTLVPVIPTPTTIVVPLPGPLATESPTGTVVATIALVLVAVASLIRRRRRG